MITRAACRPGGAGAGQDRWTVTDRSVIVLDGASAFDPAAPPADDYVRALLHALAARIDEDDPIPTLLAAAIAEATEATGAAEAGPSSTVAILREGVEDVEVAVLGDSTIMVGTTAGHVERVTDERMQTIATSERQQYRSRLRAGTGYDDEHRTTLAAIQTAERAARNRSSGYWIAESDPAAAEQVITRRHSRRTVAWSVLATDGAQGIIDHLGVPWSKLPAASEEDLHALLRELHRWESSTDPAGTLLPRAKRHDDKTIVTWRPA